MAWNPIRLRSLAARPMTRGMKHLTGCFVVLCLMLAGAPAAHAAIAQACAPIVEMAESEFRAAQSIMAKNPRRVVRAPRIMGDAYHIILEKLIARGFVPPRAPVKLPKAKLLLIVLRNLV